MPKKRATIELSMNFIVMMIIAILVFGMGLWLFGKISEKGMKSVEEVDAQFENELNNMLCDNLDKVCIPRTEVTVNRGEMAVFPIRVLNMEDGDKTFKARITGSGKAYKGGSLCLDSFGGGGTELCDPGTYSFKSGTPPPPINEDFNMQKSAVIEYTDIPPNIERKHIAAIVINGGEKGITYVFEVRMCYDNASPIAEEDTSGENVQAQCKHITPENDLYGEPMQLWITVR